MFRYYNLSNPLRISLVERIEVNEEDQAASMALTYGNFFGNNWPGLVPYLSTAPSK